MIEPLDIDVTFEHALGPGAEAGKGKWKNVAVTREQFIKFMLMHEVGPKDGLSFTQGSVANKARNAKSMIENSIIGFDLDTGETAEEIDERLAAFPYAYIRYSTHSHMNDTSEIKRDAFFEWCKDDATKDANEKLVSRYLVEVKGFLPRIVKDLTITEEAQPTDHGVIIVVKHTPMPKWRIIFFLDEPFIFQGKGIQKNLIKEWRGRYHGFGSALGFSYDQKCTDPSRLFYTPRHRKGHPFEATIFEGVTVSLRDFPDLQMGRRGLTPSGPQNSFTAATEDIGSGSEEDRERYKINGKNLKRWVMKKGIDFELQEALEEHAPEHVIRNARNNGGLIVECPFEDMHSKAGGGGFYLLNSTTNADEKEFSPGFVAACSHDSCSDRDRLDFLKKMIEDEWLPKDVLDNDDFYALLVDEETTTADTMDTGSAGNTEEYKELEQRAEKIEKGDFENIEKIASDIFNSDVSSLGKEVLYDIITKITKIRSATLQRKAQKEVDDDYCIEDDPVLMKKLKKYNRDYCYVKVGGKTILDEWCYKKTGRLALTSTNDFHDECAIDVHETRDANNKVKIEPVSKIWMRWADRRTYRLGIGFEPGMENKHMYNLFKGFKVEPSKKGSWSLLQEHMEHNICQDNKEHMDWLITWMAHIIQHPATKTGSAVVLRGRKGTGKSILFNIFGQLLDPYYFTTASSSHVTGKFNAHLTGKLLIQLEEGFFAGDAAQNSALKNLITSSTLPMEKKGVDAMQVSNYGRVCITSNELWVVPASLEDERRFAVYEVGERNMGDIDFFQALVDEIENGGLERMMYDLKNWDPKKVFSEGWNILRKPPITKGLIDQARQGLYDWERFFVNMVEDQGIPENIYLGLDEIELNEDTSTKVNTKLLRAHYRHAMKSSSFKDAKINGDNRQLFGKCFKKFVNHSGKRYKLNTFENGGQNRDNAYLVPPMKDVREHIMKRFSIPIEPPDEILDEI